MGEKMKRGFSLLCMSIILSALYACSPNAELHPGGDSTLPIEISASDISVDTPKQRVEEYLFDLGFDVVGTKASGSMVEFMINIPGVSDQNLTAPPENWTDIYDSILNAANGISEAVPDMEWKNTVIYLRDTDGNNILSVTNGKESYCVFSTETSGGYNPPTITLEEFNAIMIGMTYQEVYEIIGGPGEVISEVDLGLGEQYRTVMRQWMGEGSLVANANITFQGGKVTLKAQLGLQ